MIEEKASICLHVSLPGLNLYIMQSLSNEMVGVWMHSTDIKYYLVCCLQF